MPRFELEVLVARTVDDENPPPSSEVILPLVTRKDMSHPPASSR